MKKLNTFMAAVLLPFVTFAQSAVVKPATDAANNATEGSPDPDKFFWLLGAVFVVLFIFIIVLALAKGTKALSEQLDSTYHQQKHVS